MSRIASAQGAWWPYLSLLLIVVVASTLFLPLPDRQPWVAAESQSLGFSDDSAQGAGDVASADAAPADAVADSPQPAVQGMTVSCPRDGSSWGSDAMVRSLETLKALGVNWVAIHPYGHIEKDGSIRPYYGRSRAGQVPEYVTRPIREAHRLGMKIMIKPHISYWGSFKWRGAIEFDSQEKWDRFFADYEKWINPLAEACKSADAFVVGTELEGTTHLEAPWRKIIKGVRARYEGPITYAANWSDHHKVSFWDAVDVVGLQAYFPIASAEVAAEEASEKLLSAGWQRVMNDVKALHKKFGKQVVFTELGYTRSPLAHVEPWKPDGTVRTVGGVAEELQERCLRVALRAVAREPAVVGAFLWKWFPGSRAPRDFDQSSKAMRRVIEEVWRSPSSSESTPGSPK